MELSAAIDGIESAFDDTGGMVIPMGALTQEPPARQPQQRRRQRRG